MQVGTLMKARGTGRMFIIVGTQPIMRKKRKTVRLIQGYRLSPCSQIDRSFAVGHDEILYRFEVVS